MVINITNGEIINTKDISLHDDILEELSFDRKNKKLHLILFRECDPSSGGGNSSNTNDCITGKLCTTTCPGFTQLICIGNYKIR